MDSCTAVRNDPTDHHSAAGKVTARHPPFPPQVPWRCPWVKAIQPQSSKGTQRDQQNGLPNLFLQKLKLVPLKGNREHSIFGVQNNKREQKEQKKEAELGHKRPIGWYAPNRTGASSFWWSRSKRSQVWWWLSHPKALPRSLRFPIVQLSCKGKNLRSSGTNWNNF